jgi:hypothetical protein
MSEIREIQNDLEAVIERLKYAEAEVDRIKGEHLRLRFALRRIYDMQPNEPEESVDDVLDCPTNFGDVFSAGREHGQWDAAKIAYKALLEVTPGAKQEAAHEQD